MPGSGELVVVGWNAETDNPTHNVLTQLSSWVGAYQPDVFALSEVTSHAAGLAEVAPLLGYRVLQERPRPDQPRGDDTGDCALLLAAHVKLRRHWLVRMTRWWRVLSHDRWHRPHEYEAAAIRVRGQRWRVLAAHFPTRGIDGPNAAAWLESATRARRWLLRGRSPSAVVCDINELRATVAGWFGPGYRVLGETPDLAVTRGVRSWSSRQLGRGRSDHHGVLYVLGV